MLQRVKSVTVTLISWKAIIVHNFFLINIKNQSLEVYDIQVVVAAKAYSQTHINRFIEDNNRSFNYLLGKLL